MLIVGNCERVDLSVCGGYVGDKGDRHVVGTWSVHGRNVVSMLSVNQINLLTITLDRPAISAKATGDSQIFRTGTFNLLLFWRVQERLPCQNNLGYCQRERDNDNKKLAKDDHDVVYDLYKGDLHDSNAPDVLDDAAKDPWCEQQRVQAVQVADHREGAVLVDGG